jgi:hypothetical protein
MSREPTMSTQKMESAFGSEKRKKGQHGLTQHTLLSVRGGLPAARLGV